MAAKPFTDKANANAQAIQAATDYLTAQLQAKSRLQQAHTKIAGQLQDAHLDAKGQAAEAAMKAQHAQGQPTTPPEDVVGPQIQGVPLPQVGQASQNIPGQTLSIDPSQVSGGGGIQQASGINGGGADAAVPPTITSQSRTQGVQYAPVNGGTAFQALPQDQTTTRTIQNVMTPYQLQSLRQQNENAQQRNALYAVVQFDAMKRRALLNQATMLGMQGQLVQQKQALAQINNLTLDNEAKLRDQLGTESKDFYKFLDVGNVLLEKAAQPHTAARDLAILYNWIKLQDPNAVKEGEFALAQGTAGVFSQWGNTMDQLREGRTLLPDSTIENMISDAKNTIGSHAQVQQTREAGYAQLAGRVGLDPSHIIVDRTPPSVKALLAGQKPVLNQLPPGVAQGSEAIAQGQDGGVVYRTPDGSMVNWLPDGTVKPWNPNSKRAK
jgi:hypothetical protein